MFDVLIEGLFGTAWKKEPGSVRMFSFRTKEDEWLFYDEWRERSCFRGKSYRSFATRNDHCAQRKSLDNSII